MNLESLAAQYREQGYSELMAEARVLWYYMAI